MGYEVIGEIMQVKFCEMEQCHEIDWAIKDILSYTHRDFTCISPWFDTGLFDWNFEINFNKSSDPSEEYESGWIGLAVRETGYDEFDPTIVAFSVGLRKANGTVTKQHTSRSGPDSDDLDLLTASKFLKISELVERMSEWAPSGTLTIACTFRVNKARNFISGLIDLSSDFVNMFKSQRGCDTTLRVRNEVFSVHKSILASRSRVFHDMFRVEMNTDVVDIDDCHPGAFRDFLMFVYSGIFENSAGELFELYKIADKFRVGSLKTVCIFHISQELSVNNVIDFVILCNEFRDSELYWTFRELFNKNAADILKTEKWMTLLRNDPGKANDLLRNMAAKMRNMEAKSKKNDLEATSKENDLEAPGSTVNSPELSVNNVIDVAILCDEFRDPYLYEKCQELFDKNAADILKTEKWMTLLRKDPEKANSLLRNITENMRILEAASKENDLEATSEESDLEATSKENDLEAQ